MWSIHKCYFEIRLSYIVYIYNSTNNNAVVNLDKNKYEFSVLCYIDDKAVINLIFVLLYLKLFKFNIQFLNKYSNA